MISIKHVLCPVDFSEFSRHAFGRAVAVARGYGARLTVLHVLPVPSAVPALPYGPEGPGPFGFEPVDRVRCPPSISSEQSRFFFVGHPIYQLFRAEGEVVIHGQSLIGDIVPEIVSSFQS